MPSPRPGWVSCLCVLGLLGCFLRMFLVLDPALRQIRPWYPSFVSICTLFLILSLYGFWRMRRWSAWALGGYLVVCAAVQAALGLLDVKSLALAALLSLTSLVYYRKME